MKKFWLWAAKSFQDKDGNTSSRRATTFAVCILFLALNVWFAIEIKDKEYRIYQLILVALVLLMLLGIILWQNLKEIKALIPGLNKLPDIPNPNPATE